MPTTSPIVTTSLLRRTADAVYWAGRYLERAEFMARIVLVHGDTHVDLPVGQDVGWTPLLAVAGVEPLFARSRQEVGSASTTSGRSKSDLEGEVVEFLLCAPENPGNVLASIKSVREAMRSSRSSIPREAWERCNDLSIALKSCNQGVRMRPERLQWLRVAIAGCERLNGALWGTMPRDAAMAFTRIGQHLERAEMTCRVLSVRAESVASDDHPDPYAQVRSMAVLRSLAAYEAFRRTVPARSHDGSIARFLLEEESFPRTVAACLIEVRNQLKDLPHNEEVLAACADTSVRLAGSRVHASSAASLRQFVSGLQESIIGLHHQIESVYFHGAVPMTSASPSPTPPATGSVNSHRSAPRTPTAPTRTFRVVHRTVYRYEAPAEQSYNEAHLRPRNTEHQRRAAFGLDVDPAPEVWSEHRDLLGNDVVTFLVRGAFDELSVTSTSVVEVFARPDPPLGPPWESVRAVLDVDRQPPTRAARMYRTPSRLVPVWPALSDYALVSFVANRPVTDAVVDLCRRIHRDFAYEPGLTSVTTPLPEVFEHRRGVCQDFAHLAVACLRSVGLAGRYVSGYVESAPVRGVSLIGTEASHAWASTYLPGWGWLDIDPTNDQLVSESHVTTAWGRDYGDVSPLRGSVVGGGRAHDLDVGVEVTRVDSS